MDNVLRNQIFRKETEFSGKLFLVTFLSILQAAEVLLHSKKLFFMLQLNTFFTGFIGVILCMTLYTSVSFGQCPTLSKYKVEYDQVQEVNNGILTFVFKKSSEITQLRLDDYEYNLWDKNRGVYLYSPSKLDAGFYEDKNITVSIDPSGTIEFRNVPPGNSYRLVVSSPDCKRVYGPEEGITVKKSER